MAQGTGIDAVAKFTGLLMPSDEEKRQRLIELGFDPSRFSFDPPTQPASAFNAPVQSSTATGAAGRALRRSLVPSLVGITAAAAAAPFSGGGSLAFVPPLIAGIGAGAGAGYLQEKLKPTTPEEAAQIQAEARRRVMVPLGGFTI